MSNNIKEIQEFVFKAAFKHFSEYSEEQTERLLRKQTGLRCLMRMDRNKLTLTRVLNACRGTGLVINSVGTLLKIGDSGDIYTLGAHWNLHKDDFQDQTHETQRTLAELLGWEGGDE